MCYVPALTLGAGDTDNIPALKDWGHRQQTDKWPICEWGHFWYWCERGWQGLRGQVVRVVWGSLFWEMMGIFYLRIMGFWVDQVPGKRSPPNPIHRLNEIWNAPLPSRKEMSLEFELSRVDEKEWEGKCCDNWMNGPWGQEFHLNHVLGTVSENRALSTPSGPNQKIKAIPFRQRVPKQPNRVKLMCHSQSLWSPPRVSWASGVCAIHYFTVTGTCSGTPMVFTLRSWWLRSSLDRWVLDSAVGC